MQKWIPTILAFCMILCSFSGCSVSQEPTFEIESTDDTNVAQFPDEDIVVETDVIDYEAYFNGFYAKEGVFYGAEEIPWMYSYELLGGEFVPGGTIELRITRMYVGDEPCVWKGPIETDDDNYGRYHYTDEDYPYPNTPVWHEYYLKNFAYLYFYKDGERQSSDDNYRMSRGYYGYYAWTDEAREWRSASNTRIEYDDLVIRYGDVFASDMHITIADDVEFDEVWLLANSGRDIQRGILRPRKDRTVTLGIIYSKDSPDYEDDGVTDTTATVDEEHEPNAE